MTLPAPSSAATAGASETTRVVVQVEVAGARVPVVLHLDAGALAAIASAVASATRDEGQPWLYGDKAAADYLGWPLGRVQKLSAAGRLPCHRIGQRKAYRHDELDAVLRAA